MFPGFMIVASCAVRVFSRSVSPWAAWCRSKAGKRAEEVWDSDARLSAGMGSCGELIPTRSLISEAKHGKGKEMGAV